MDPYCGHLRHEQLLAEAAASRLRRECRGRSGIALRVYARVWWASRPRVDTWSRSALEV